MNWKRHSLFLFYIIYEITQCEGKYIPPGPKYKCPPLNLIWPCVCLSSTDLGLNVRCNDVSLATISAGLSTYLTFQNDPVESLHLFNFNSERVYGNLFEGLNITKLKIENSTLKDISGDFFFNIRESLKELALINTNLDEFPHEAFEELKFLETLILDGHNISELKRPIKGLEGLKHLRVSNGNVSEISKETFSSLGKLTRLDLHKNHLKTFPKDSFQALKSVEFFDISHNNFQKLEGIFFVNLVKLTWFNGSYNELKEFRRDAFARNGYLRVIHMTHNKIAKLDAAAFRGMRLLVRLYLSDNQIADIGRAAFNSLNRIATIDLARNKLKIVDYQMFFQLRFVEMIDLSENAITRITSGAFNEINYAVINMSRNAISSIEKNAIVSCVNITVLDMSHNEIDNFTRGAFDELSYPTEWRLEHNKLKNFGDIPLKFMSGIKTLNVSYNDLAEIPKNSIPKLYELYSIDFSHNNISKIFPAIFTNLFSLRYLDLSHNSLTEVGASVFGMIPTLIDLDLNDNKLKRVSGAAFSRLVSLRELRISRNFLTTVFQISPGLNKLVLSHNEIGSLNKAWPVMNSLLSLDLSYNKLGGNLEKGSFQNLGSLQRLNLSSNQITEIPLEALSDLTTIQYLDFSENLLVNLKRAAFGRLPIVFELLLSKNNISMIEMKAFEGLLQLLHLDLSENALTDIPVGALSGLVSLQLVNLSRNALERTDNTTHCLFEENLSLETIDLSHNKIAFLTSLTLPENRWIPYKIHNVDLSFNQISTITKEILKGTRRTKFLNLRGNKIKEIRPNILGNLTQLERLDLSRNQISFIELKTLGPPSNLSELILTRNYLRKFPTEILSKAPLKLIDLRGNRIGNYDPDFLSKVKNGSRLILLDNPIACDCRLISLQRYFKEYRPTISNFSKEFYEDYEDFKCGSSGDKFLKDLTEEELACDYVEDPLAPKITPNYDLDLRSLTQKGKNYEIRWRVKSKMDISGFRVSINDGEGNELVKNLYGYNMRKSVGTLPSYSFSICILPTYSRKLVELAGPRICQQVDQNAISFGFKLSAHITTLATLSVLLNLIF